MGGGSYSYDSDIRVTRTKAFAESYARGGVREVFQSSRMDKSMSPVGIVRESRDSAEHPESFPIIIALDVTGSMGSIPAELITGGFPTIMKNIMDEGIEHPQVCFVAIGDHTCDDAPIQVGQFESSDELLDSWFKKVWIEGGGGGNDGESYGLAWYFGAYMTKCDSFEKRGKKGVLITIGDEPILPTIDADSLKKVFGNNQYPTSMVQALEDCSERWDVHHINVTSTFSGRRKSVKDKLEQMLHDKVIMTEGGQTSVEIPAIISKLVIDSYKGEAKEETPTVTENKSELKDF